MNGLLQLFRAVTTRGNAGFVPERIVDGRPAPRERWATNEPDVAAYRGTVLTAFQTY
jgi:hypothetical protein